MEQVDEILQRFEQISSLPRGTKQEQKIFRGLRGWAEDMDLGPLSEGYYAYGGVTKDGIHALEIVLMNQKPF